MTMDEAPVHRLVARQAVPGTNSNGFACALNGALNRVKV